MNTYPEIQIHKFQLGVLLTGIDKKFYNYIIKYNIYCSCCKSLAFKGIFVDEIYLTKYNDVRVVGRCKICNSEVLRLFEFGNEKEFRNKANKIRESINELTLLRI